MDDKKQDDDKQIEQPQSIDKDDFKEHLELEDTTRGLKIILASNTSSMKTLLDNAEWIRDNFFNNKNGGSSSTYFG